MNKRYFVVETGRYGGEVCVGWITQNFYNFWKRRDENDLISALFSDGDGYQDSPLPTGDDDYWTPWHDIDDIYHSNSPCASNSYTVTEIILANGAAVGEDSDIVDTAGLGRRRDQLYTEIDNVRKTFDSYHHVHSHEIYAADFEDQPDEGFAPVLFTHSEEKGSFGEVIIETNGDGFDNRKFRIETVETEVGEFIHAYWYDQKKLGVCFDYSDSCGKGFRCALGYMNREEHERYFKPLAEESIAETWELDEEYE
eukprot:m.204220 g.204220  ORF g.204220 m.204220 type:complete len:254 (+) comp22445_c0_seq1:174-935(+)